MGISMLNKLLKKNCKNQEIKTIHLEYLSGKTIVIDTSIYLYKFKAKSKDEDQFYYNFISLIIKFKKYKITPIFALDGKIMENKKDTIINRTNTKIISQLEILDYEYKQNNGTLTPDELIKFEQLKLNITSVSNDERINIKKIFDSFNIKYLESFTVEADKICYNLVKNNIAWACLSDDMDMFAYGCSFVLRELNLDNDTLILYDTKKILKTLNISMNHFRTICLLTGADYYPEMKSNNIFYLFELYKTYIKSKSKICFIDWLSNKINNYDKNKFNQLLSIFND